MKKIESILFFKNQYSYTIYFEKLKIVDEPKNEILYSIVLIGYLANSKPVNNADCCFIFWLKEF